MVLFVLSLLSFFAPADRIVAIVGDTPILYSDVVSYLEDEGVYLGSAAPDSLLYERALQAIIDERILVEAARQSGYYPAGDVVSELVASRLSEMRSGFGSEEEFLQALSEAGVILPDLERRLAEVLGDRSAAQDFISARTNASMSSLPADPVSYLRANSDFIEEQLLPRHLGWILLPVVASDSAAAGPLALLTELRARLLAGERFEDLASAYSEDPGSASLGGDLGLFAPGDMTPAFEKALAGLGPGGVSLPFLTPYGAHLARLDTEGPGDSLSASHILIALPLSPFDLERTLQEAAGIREEIASGLVTFAGAALQYSADVRTAGSGGDLGVLLVRRTMPEIASAVASLRPGEVSEPVPVQEGTAVAIFSLLGEDSSVDWRSFDPALLGQMVQSIEYERGVGALVDSLRGAFPVVRQ
jgi:peptidyl-prolyl cis-trans isomerase SurA